MNALGKLFLKGLVVVIPVSLTLSIMWWLAREAEQILGGVLARFLPEGWYIPGMGMISAVAITILIGLLTHVILFQKLFAFGDAVLHRLPLVKTIYSALKDFIAYLSPDSQIGLSKVVLVKIPGQEFEQLGFVTREDFSRLPDATHGRRTDRRVPAHELPDRRLHPVLAPLLPDTPGHVVRGRHETGDHRHHHIQGKTGKNRATRR